MKIEDQVCSLDLAMKLKASGVKQEALYFHIAFEEYDVIKNDIFNAENMRDAKTDGWEFEVMCAAFTVAELGEMLPVYSDYGSPVTSKLGNQPEGIVFQCGYLDNDNDNDVEAVHRTMDYFGIGVTEADARARMLVYLIESKLITVQEPELCLGCGEEHQHASGCPNLRYGLHRLPPSFAQIEPDCGVSDVNVLCRMPVCKSCGRKVKKEPISPEE